MVLTTIIDINETFIEEMQAFLKNTPIDHKWTDKDIEAFDGDCPVSQEIARDYFDTLKALNRLPDGVPGGFSVSLGCSTAEVLRTSRSYLF